MATRSTTRTWVAISIVFVVVMAQLGAMTVIAMSAWGRFTSSSNPVLQFPFIQLGTMFRGEIVVPMCGMRFVPGAMQNGNVRNLRFVNPVTGQIRDLDVSGCTSQPLGLVTNDKSMWIIGQQEVFECDGTRVVKVDARTSLRLKESLPFLYENQPAIIERDSEGNFYLAKFVDGNWTTVGRIAMPGSNRIWTVDAETGESRLVPRTSAESNAKGLKPFPIRVLPIHQEFHLFHVERRSAQSFDDLIFAYRVGFDFVPEQDEAEPASAMAPSNDVADTSGWVLLDSKMASAFPCQAVQNGAILLGNDTEIWQQIRSEGSVVSRKFERVAKLEKPDDSLFEFHLLSSPDTKDAYVIAGDLLVQFDLFQLRDSQLQKTSATFEGMGPPLKRWLVGTLLQEISVICVASIALALVSAFFASTSTYSSGHETVMLAPVLRRCLARCVDLGLIFAPFLIFTWLLLMRIRLDVILKKIGDVDSLLPLLPVVVWSIAAWLATVITTALWGFTPGKLLFGLRVVRTSLRPCGLSRALLRELLLWLDSPQFLTVLPGILCIVISRNRQRIGDLAAGTLVIAKHASR